MKQLLTSNFSSRKDCLMSLLHQYCNEVKKCPHQPRPMGAGWNPFRPIIVIASNQLAPMNMNNDSPLHYYIMGYFLVLVQFVLIAMYLKLNTIKVGQSFGFYLFLYLCWLCIFLILEIILLGWIGLSVILHMPFLLLFTLGF